MIRLINNIYDDIIARGPLAGFVVIKALTATKNKPKTLSIQARGLCAEEYRYAHLKIKQPFYKIPIHKHIYQELKKTECEVFGHTSVDYKFLIESVQ